MVSKEKHENVPAASPDDDYGEDYGNTDVMEAYQDAYEDYAGTDETPDDVPNDVPQRVTRKAKKKPAKDKPVNASVDAADSHTDEATDKAADDAPEEKAKAIAAEIGNVAAMVTSPVESTKELGLKLEKARRAMAKSKDAERLRAIPEATAENPDPWVSGAGASAGLAPIPPKGVAPALKKNGNKAEKSDNHKEKEENPKGTEAPSAKSPSASKAVSPAKATQAAKGKARSAGQKASSKHTGKKTGQSGLIGSLVTAADDGLSTDPAGHAAKDEKKDEGKALSSNASKKPAKAKAATTTASSEKATKETTVSEDGDEEEVNLDDPRYRDDGVPTGLVEDIAPKRLTQKEIKALPGRMPTVETPKLPSDDDEENPAVAALISGSWLTEDQPIHSVYRHDVNLDGPEGSGAGMVLNAKEAMGETMEEEEKDFLRHRTPARPPQPDWKALTDRTEKLEESADSSAAPQGSPLIDDRRIEADYAMRMDAWEKAVIATNERKRCDIPDQHRPQDVRENLGTGTDTTVAGFPAPMPLREWTTEDGKPVQVDAVKDEDLEGHGMAAQPDTKVGRLVARWQRTDRLLRLALTTLMIASVGAVSGWLSARIALPSIVAEATPVAIAAIVREEDVRELMVLANLLDEKAHTHRRAPIAISPVYLPDSLLDTEGRPLPGLLTDLHFRAALKEAADRLGAPVMSASTVLAIPSAGEEKHPLATQTLDITEDVKALLGLSGLESAALRDLVNQWLKAEERLQANRQANNPKNRR